MKKIIIENNEDLKSLSMVDCDYKEDCTLADYKCYDCTRNNSSTDLQTEFFNDFHLQKEKNFWR